jgi:hypothetical protein
MDRSSGKSNLGMSGIGNKFSDLPARRRGPKHHALSRAHAAVFSSPRLHSVGSGPRRASDRPFEMVWRELPRWDCAVEAHFKCSERRMIG